MQNNSNNIKINDSKSFNETKNSRNFEPFVMFLIWPFLGVLLSFKNYKYYNSRNAIWLYSIFLGFTMSILKDSDASRYAEELHRYHHEYKYSVSEFFEYLFLNSLKSSLELLQPCITFIVSNFTDNPSILLGAFGFVFGYFYSRNIWFLVDRIKGKIRPEALSFFLLFSFLIPIWGGINGFRFWTATHIFIYGVITFICDKKIKKGLFFIIITIFIHDTFAVSIAIFLLFLLLKNFPTLIFCFYLITTLSGDLGRTTISDYYQSNTSTNSIKDRSAYLNEEYKVELEEKDKQLNWYIKYNDVLMQILVGLCMSWVFIFRRKQLKSIIFLEDFFCIGLLFIGITNLFQDVPSFPRFYYIGYMFVTLLLFMFFQNTNFKRRPEWFKILSLSVAAFVVFIKIWSGGISISLASLIANPFTMYIFDFNDSLNVLIKYLF